MPGCLSDDEQLAAPARLLPGQAMLTVRCCCCRRKFSLTPPGRSIRFVYFDAEGFVAQNPAPSTQHEAAAGAAAASLSDSDSDEAPEPPCYQPNQWSWLPSLNARLLVLDGADPRALQAATGTLLVRGA